MRPGELAGRAHPEGVVRVHLVVVFEPAIELGQERSGVGAALSRSVIALEGFHERLGDAVGLRAAHGREARHEADGVSEGDRLVGREAAAVVGQPLHRAAGRRARKRRSTASSMRSRTANPPMPRGLAVQARTSRSWVSIANATRTAFAVPAQDLEHVRGPAPVRGGRRDLTVMGPLAATPGMARQQQSGPLHHAVDTLVV